MNGILRTACRSVISGSVSVRALVTAVSAGGAGRGLTAHGEAGRSARCPHSGVATARPCDGGRRATYLVEGLRSVTTTTTARDNSPAPGKLGLAC
jgi:hypothetical protein